MVENHLKQKTDFKELLEQKRSWYQKIGRVFCPILNEWVTFNAKGFYHLRYDGTGNIRTQKEQERRFTALESSVEVIQEALEIIDFQKRNSGEYWRITKRINNKDTVVILRRNIPGPLIFYSTWQD